MDDPGGHGAECNVRQKEKRKKYCMSSLTCEGNEFLTAKPSGPFLVFVLLDLVVPVVDDYFFSETLTSGFEMTFQGTLLSSSWGFLSPQNL